ncbi:MAG: hypothetical protein KGS60_12790 [Verrucomicrobia bacterium]|nr:hypothetical protein [Verrucomicrobiota bacterium]
MDSSPLDQPLLTVLQRAGSRGELTLGALRGRVARCLGGSPLSSADLQNRVHALWRQGRLTIEPPPPGRRGIRIRPAATSAVPTPPASSHPGRSEEFLHVCSQLASAYHRFEQTAAKEEIARLLFNLGVVRSDSEGALTSFLGRRHLCEVPLLPGDRVKVLESGWLLRDCPGDHLLSKSRVIPA